MRDADNDNEPLTFTQIGLQAALILNMLRLQAQIRSSEQNFEKPVQSVEKQDRNADEQREKNRNADIAIKIGRL